ncbi:MAG: hypothetical protein HQM13_23960 [SAR324 cluster bacterium]|nr:hypothetical protein [SAR324 cluster bacterium]
MMSCIWYPRIRFITQNEGYIKKNSEYWSIVVERNLESLGLTAEEICILMTSFIANFYKYSLFGEKVSSAISEFLNACKNQKSLPSKEPLVGTTILRMRGDYKNSRDKNYWKELRTFGLIEHEYEAEISDEVWKKTADEVQHCISNFYDSEVYANILKIPLESWKMLGEITSFVFNGLKVYPAFDFLSQIEDRVFIYDWKTGHSLTEDHDLRMACYGWYSWHNMGTDPKKVGMLEVNLSSNSSNKYDLSGVNLEKI